jgi:transposase InsO family protein
VSQDIGIGESASFGWCRRLVWSSPPCSSKVVRSRRSPEITVSQGWISRLIKRYTAEGEAAFQPRSRRPHSSPRRLPQTTIDLIIELRHILAGKGLDAGPHTIAWHLHHHHQLRVSPASISRHLRGAGLVEPTPQKRPKSSYIRFAAQQPNQRWQSDFTHWRLANGTHVEILCWLDDCSRLALSVTAHRRITGALVVDEFTKAIAQHGIPYSTLTDIQSGWAVLSLSCRPARKDRCRPAPARRRYLTDWSAQRLLAC